MDYFFNRYKDDLYNSFIDLIKYKPFNKKKPGNDSKYNLKKGYFFELITCIHFKCYLYDDDETFNFKRNNKLPKGDKGKKSSGIDCIDICNNPPILYQAKYYNKNHSNKNLSNLYNNYNEYYKDKFDIIFVINEDIDDSFEWLTTKIIDDNKISNIIYKVFIDHNNITDNNITKNIKQWINSLIIDISKNYSIEEENNDEKNNLLYYDNQNLNNEINNLEDKKENINNEINNLEDKKENINNETNKLENKKENLNIETDKLENKKETNKSNKKNNEELPDNNNNYQIEDFINQIKEATNETQFYKDETKCLKRLLKIIVITIINVINNNKNIINLKDINGIISKILKYEKINNIDKINKIIIKLLKLIKAKKYKNIDKLIKKLYDIK